MKYKKTILYSIKLIILLLIFYFISQKIDFNKLVANFKKLDWYIFVILLVLEAIRFYLRYLNWVKYLKINPDFNASKKEILHSHFIGYSLRLILPGGIGTFGKAFFLKNEKKFTILSTFLESFFLTWSILAIASISAFFYFKSLANFLKISIALLVIFLPYILKLVVQVLHLKKYKVYFIKFKEILSHVIFLQIFAIVLIPVEYFVIISFLENFSIVSTFKTIPLIMVSKTIPISFSGLGLRETFAINILKKYSISPETAVSATLLIFIFTAVIPALSGTYFLFKHKKESNS